MILADDMMTILYVEDLSLSRDFYEMLLNLSPTLVTEGMVEFPITESSRLGLMPRGGIEALLDPVKVCPPVNASEDVLNKISIRGELYLYVDDPARYLQQAQALGARILSEPSFRNWGDKVGYCVDPDGYVLAFASRGCVEG